MTLTASISRRRGRPPKSLSGANETRESLLRAGIEVLTEKGFCASGLDEILKRVSVPKGSFYHYFNSKDDFGSELIKRYDEYFATKLDQFLLDQSLPPLQRIQAFSADAAVGMARYNFRRGCLVGNLGQEMGALPDGFRQQIIGVFNNWQQKLEDCLQQASAAGHIPQHSDCKQLSKIFWTGWEGAVLRAKLEQSADPLNVFTAFYLSALEAGSLNN